MIISINFEKFKEQMLRTKVVELKPDENKKMDVYGTNS